MKRWMMMAILGLLIGACGAGVSGSDSSAAEDVDDTTTESAVEGDDNSEPGVETLADFFGGNQDPEEAEAQFREQETRIQELIRQCMAEEGFEYIPVEPPAESFVYDDATQEEYAAEQGFGITTWVGNEDQFVDEGIEWTDPNQEIVDAMSESEQEAYYAALYGSEEENEALQTVEVDPETGEEIYMQEGFGPGCNGEAYAEVYGNQEDLWEELGPEMEAMYERMQADPRIVEANGEWSTCMADQGHAYESPEAMYESAFQDFETRLEEIVGANMGYVDPFEGWTEEEINAFFEEKTQEEIDAFFEQSESQDPEYDQEALAALQQEEIELAVAAAQCQTVVDEAFQEVSAEYEADFIEQHRDELEAIKASQEGSG